MVDGNGRNLKTNLMNFMGEEVEVNKMTSTTNQTMITTTHRNLTMMTMTICSIKEIPMSNIMSINH